MSPAEILDEAYDELPAVLAMVAEACGYGAALTFASTFGGAELYIPTPERLGEDHPLAVALDVATARCAAKALGHGKVIVPLGPAAQTRQKRRAHAKLAGQPGWSNSKIARALGCHQRTIERYNAETREDEDRDPDLFD